jgi:hypothetical protein
MLAVLIAVALVAAQADASPSRPGPCSAGLAQIERQVAQSKSGSLEGPTAVQTVEAQLHHQPTIAAVKQGEHRADTKFHAALSQARDANARGDATACTNAMNRARKLYGTF